MKLFCHFVFAFVCLPVRAAQPIVPAAGIYVYTQNFDGLYTPTVAGNVAATPAWADNATIPNWWFYYAANAPTGGGFAGAAFAYNANDGSIPPALTLNSQGSANNPDRAFASPSTTARGEQSGIVVFQNAGTSSVELTAVRFAGEVRRTNSTANNVESVFVWYRKAASQAEALTLTTAPTNTTVFPTTVSTSPTSWYISGWSQIDSARWTYSNVSPAATVDISVPVSATGLSGIRVAPGEFLALRFSNINDGGTDALLGIDDLSVTFSETNSGINATVSNVVRNDSGTPQDSFDDTIGFDLLVNGSGAVGPGWGISAPASIATSGNPYGVLKSFANVPLSEFAAVAPHTLTATIVDSADAGLTESFTVTAPWTTISVSGNSFVRLPGPTPDPVDDTFTLNLHVTGQFLSSAWNSDGFWPIIPATGAYNINVPTNESSAAFIFGPITILDSVEFTTAVSDIYISPPYLIGLSNLGGAPQPVLSNGSLTTGGANASTWTNDSTLRILQMSDGDRFGGTTAREVTADVSLAGVSGTVVFSMQMVATDGSSGFEPADTFTASLLLNDGVNPAFTVSLLTAAQDTNNDGILAGSEIVSANATATFDFSHFIPDNIQSARLIIRGICDSLSVSERMDVQNIRFDLAQPIVPGQASMALNNGAAGKLSAASVIALATGGSSPLTISAVQSVPTGRGSTAGLQDGWLIYDPAAGITGADAFSYSITDGTQTVTGIVTVAMFAPGGQQLNIAGIVPEGGGNRVVGAGIPERSYIWQYSGDLQVWTAFSAPVVCPSSGVFSVVDPGPLPPQRFYRLLESVTP